MSTLTQRLFSSLKKYYFVIFFGSGILIYTLQYCRVRLPEIANNYVNDFLCIPVVLFICQSAARHIRSDPTLRIPLAPLLTITVFYCVYFEYYLPLQNERYTADIIDIVLYFCGLLFFYCMEYIDLKTIS